MLVSDLLPEVSSSQNQNTMKEENLSNKAVKLYNHILASLSG